MVVTISAAAERRLRDHAEAAYPHEGCGVMIGRFDGDAVTIEEVTSGRNLVTSRSHDRYLLDPGAIVAAERSARTRDLDIVGFWHTHPDHPAWPSHFDADNAWTDYVYVICGVRRGGCDAIKGFLMPAPEAEFEPAEMVFSPTRPATP